MLLEPRKMSQSLPGLESILTARVLTAYCIIARQMKRLCNICHISAFSPHNINYGCGLGLKMYDLLHIL